MLTALGAAFYQCNMHSTRKVYMQDDDGSRNALKWITEGCGTCERERIINEILEIFTDLNELGKARLFLELIWEFDKSPMKKRLQMRTV